MRTGDDEATIPKYAHVERERRWLVDPRRRPPVGDDAGVLIEDRYLTGTRMRLRRMTEPQTGRRALKLTKKYESHDPRARPIVTAYLTEDEYAVFAALDARPLAKRRLPLVDGTITFSLDLFLGPLTGLELAEREWPDGDGLRRLPTPPWAVREVSDDARYQGGWLSDHGLPEDRSWPLS